MWQIQPIPLADAKVLSLPVSKDVRGSFVKTFHASTFSEAGIDFTLRESYFSISAKDVVRGMHFQRPPHQHSKIVFCPQGAILDVIIDLRKSSPTFRQHYALELSADNNLAVFIPEGFAHGFKTLSESAITYYFVSSEYDADSDRGIFYDSIGFDWNLNSPIISSRDSKFDRLEVLKSPF